MSSHVQDGTSQTRLKTVESHMKNQLQQHQGNLTMHWHVQISRQSCLHMASGFGSSQQASDNGEHFNASPVTQIAQTLPRDSSLELDSSDAATLTTSCPYHHDSSRNDCTILCTPWIAFSVAQAELQCSHACKAGYVGCGMCILSLLSVRKSLLLASHPAQA